MNWRANRARLEAVVVGQVTGDSALEGVDREAGCCRITLFRMIEEIGSV